MTSLILPSDFALFTAADLDAVTIATPAIRRALRRGKLVKLHRGVYLEAETWRTLDADARYLARVHAAMRCMSPDSVASHQSAVAAWGLPIIGRWPSEVHLLAPRASGGRSDPGVRRHALGITDDDWAERDGIRVTTLARTVVDVAASASLYSAVATVDAAIHRPRDGAPLLTKQEIYEEWSRMMPFRGHARALRVIDFAEDGADSTSESTSRVSMALLGFPPPELQRPFTIGGDSAFVDFYFREADAIGECDGKEKYLSAELRGGRSLEQVLLEEKAREDALRRQVRAFGRWGSREAMSPGLLRVKLLEMGLTQGAPRLRGK